MIPVDVDLSFENEQKEKKADRLSKYQDLLTKNIENNEEAGTKK